VRWQRSKHAGLMQRCLEARDNPQLYQMLIEYNEPKAKGGILRLRGATRGGTIDDKGRERKELLTRSARGHARFADQSPVDTAENVGAAAGEDSKGVKGSFSKPSSSDSDGSSGSGASSTGTAEHAGVRGVASDEGDEESFEERLIRRVLGELHNFGDSSEWVIQVNTHTHTHKKLLEGGREGGREGVREGGRQSVCATTRARCDGLCCLCDGLAMCVCTTTRARSVVS
jgi:hypothetical protein